MSDFHSLRSLCPLLLTPTVHSSVRGKCPPVICTSRAQKVPIFHQYVTVLHHHPWLGEKVCNTMKQHPLTLPTLIPSLDKVSTSTSATFNTSAWGQLHLKGLKGKAHVFSKGKTKDCGKTKSRQEGDHKENLDGIFHVLGS